MHVSRAAMAMVEGGRGVRFFFREAQSRAIPFRYSGRTDLLPRSYHVVLGSAWVGAEAERETARTKVSAAAQGDQKKLLGLIVDE